MTTVNWALWFIVGAVTAYALLALFEAGMTGIIAATLTLIVFAALGGLDYLGSKMNREPTIKAG